MKVYLPALIVVAVGMSGCGAHVDKGSPPTGSEVSSALTRQMLMNGTGSFASIDHIEVGSIKPDQDTAFTSNIHYEMVFNKGLPQITRELESSQRPTSAAEALERQKLIYGLMALKLQFGNFAAGLRVPRDANVSLRRDARGWEMTLLPNPPGARLASGTQAPMGKQPAATTEQVKTATGKRRI